MYTRQGDSGDTNLFGSKRVSKDSLRVEAYGAVDELNSSLGVAIAHSNNQEITRALKEIQRILFIAGADLAAEIPAEGREDRVPRITATHTKMLENWIDDLLKKLPRLENFILPGGTKLASEIHVARSICRRAERRIVSLNRREKINPELLPFFNRLSTYLFNLARYANMCERVNDEIWTV